MKESLTHHNIVKLKESVPNEYITDNGKLSEKGIKLIKDVELLFKPLKNLNDIQSLGDNYSEYIDQYILIFPTGKLPNNKYARGDKKSIQSNFVWFFQEYDYSWDTIIKATKLYVKEYKERDYMHMRTAMYFIKKLHAGSILCDLATYCDAVSSSSQKQELETEEETNLGRVV